jgi:hypothetical protein
MKKIFLCTALAVSSAFWGTSVVVASAAEAPVHQRWRTPVIYSPVIYLPPALYSIIALWLQYLIIAGATLLDAYNRDLEAQDGMFDRRRAHLLLKYHSHWYNIVEDAIKMKQAFRFQFNPVERRLLQSVYCTIDNTVVSLQDALTSCNNLVEQLVGWPAYRQGTLNKLMLTTEDDVTTYRAVPLLNYVVDAGSRQNSVLQIVQLLMQRAAQD